MKSRWRDESSVFRNFILGWFGVCSFHPSESLLVIIDKKGGWCLEVNFQRLIVFPYVCTWENKDLEMKMGQVGISRHTSLGNFLTCRYNLAHSYFTTAKCKVVISRILFILMFYYPTFLFTTITAGLNWTGKPIQYLRNFSVYGCFWV